MRILLDAKAVAEMFDVELKYVRLWTRLGILPVKSGPPYVYDHDVMCSWIVEGKLEKHRPIPKTEFKHEEGFWVR